MHVDPVRDGLLVLGGYLVGSIPVGVLMARLTGGRDPRTVGSGRTGGTNAYRAMGPIRGVAVGVLDVLKGLLPVAGVRLLGADDVVVAAVGVAAVAGAWRSAFLRFHGGRGVATGVGAMLAIAPIAIVLAAPVFFGAVLLSRYVSLASLVGSAATVTIVAVLVWLGVSPPAALLYGLIAAGIIWLAHADNIERLLHGQERKLDFGRARRP